MDFQTKLTNIISKNNSFVSIGLDPEFAKLPPHIQSKANPQFEFNKAIIDATHDLIAVFKPNSAFYEARGEQGIKELQLTCKYIRQTYPEIPIILDFKRADIGNTNNGYVHFAYDYLQADAVTINPYLGREAVQPFLDRKDKMAFILCKTSNHGGGEFQNLLIDGKPLYQIVAEKVANEWNSNENCGFVVGATYPEELQKVRERIGDMPILLPGIGAQGGDLENSVKFGQNNNKQGLLLSSSRGIIFASQGEDFADRAREEAIKLRDEINNYR